jgi:8-oxo-dGTP pyrophosphatase MutT (NUDIX family)
VEYGRVTLPEPAAPSLSATVIVTREYGGRAEVLLLRRQPTLRMLGGFWVFPGGNVDAADASLPACDCPPRDSHLAALAGCRELFEEAGLLVAVHAADNRPLDDAPAFDAGLTLDAWLRQHALLLDPGRLLDWAHWITPSTLRRRFDTRFFLVELSPDAPLSIASGESSEAHWDTPEGWMRAGEREDFPLTPPTRLVLRELAESLDRHGSLASLRVHELAREVLPVQPKVVIEGDAEFAVMPWAPEYAGLPGEGREWPSAAAAARAGWPTRLPTRVARG